jgi:hypothetical protein
VALANNLRAWVGEELGAPDIAASFAFGFRKKVSEGRGCDSESPPPMDHPMDKAVAGRGGAQMRKDRTDRGGRY